ncbi:hypothetical protein [Novosphingobium sp. KN65.2]|uniref:hypothetical protein n=1 Tax=Novosphingobium sp. KN65.2 TaxID=1478134 RepID=UPI003514A31D
MNAVLGYYAKAFTLGRAGVPDDIARVVLFLASDLAGFVSGVVVLSMRPTWHVEFCVSAARRAARVHLSFPQCRFVHRA